MDQNNPIITFLLEHNKRQSELFCSPDAALARRQYRATHPTEIAALKCMDGRLNLAVQTQTPPGIIQPFRNIGGMFDIGWPYFGEIASGWVNYAISKGRSGVILVTYHYSKGDAHRGCRGFNYDTEAAKAYTRDLSNQIERVFGTEHKVIYPIQVGIETDDEALIVHGKNGETLNLAEEPAATEDALRQRVEKLYPDMGKQMAVDIVPLFLGNQRHIAAIRASNRPVVNTEHREQVLVVGRGMDWLHLPNKALIVGPYSYNLREPIVAAAGILLDNIKKGRVPEQDGLVLLTSAAYREDAGFEKLRAIEKARSFADFALDAIYEAVPEIKPHLYLLASIVDLNTRLLTVVPPRNQAPGTAR